MSDERDVMTKRTPKELVDDVEWKADVPFGPHIEQALEQLVEELDKRYE